MSQQPERGSRVVQLGIDELDDRVSTRAFPCIEKGEVKSASVLEVPVETALRHSETRGERLDADRLHATVTQRLEGPVDPFLS